MRRLRETLQVTPAVTRETRTVTRVTRLRGVTCRSRGRARVHMRVCARVHMEYQVPRNRVTHVTTGVPGVTAGVTHVTTTIAKERRVSDEMDRQEKARAVRESFPTCAAAAAEFAAVFPGTRMVFASENGLEIGRKGPDGVRPVLDRLGDVKPAEPVLGRSSRGARQMPLQGGARQIPLQGGAGSSVASDGAAGGLGGAGASQRRAIGGAPA